jgi:hypothetical protein
MSHHRPRADPHAAVRVQSQICAGIFRSAANGGGKTEDRHLRCHSSDNNGADEVPCPEMINR